MMGIKILEEAESPVNGKIQVIKALGLGTYIQADGITQSGGIVEQIWKRTLKKVHRSPITVHRSLILGLGGGSAAKWIRKLWPKAEIIGVDIDPVMVELGIRHLGLGKSNVKIKIEDAFDFCTNAYDLILVDLYIGDNYPKKFESEKFLKNILKLLTVDGVGIFNRLYYGDKRPQAVRFGNKLEKIFKNVEWFYPQANLMFICRK